MSPEFLIALYGVMTLINTAYSVASYVHGAMFRGFFTSLVAIFSAWGFVHFLASVLS